MSTELSTKSKAEARNAAPGSEATQQTIATPRTAADTRPPSEKRTLRAAMKEMRWHLGLGLFVLLSLPVTLIPRRLAIWAGGMAGSLAFHLLRRVRKTAVGNIRDSLPYLETMEGWSGSHGTPEEIARRTFANFGRSFVEVLKLYYGLGRSLIDGVEFRGLEHYTKAAEREKGIIFITGHCGNWELMALSFGARHAEVSVVARRLRYERFNRLIERLRHNFGNRVIYTTGAAKGIFFELRRKGVVGILVDQAVKENEGAIVDFFGRGAWTATMPAVMAERSGVPLLPIFIHREGGRNVVTIHPEIEIRKTTDGKVDILATTREVNRAIEEYIAHHPDEWLWVYKRWKRT